MSLDFSGKDLRGYDFRGQNLTEVNFTNSDIRGANFTNAILTQAKFNYAKAGLQTPQVFWLVTVLIIVAVIAGFSTVFSTVICGYLLFPFSVEPDFFIAAILVFILFAVFLLVVWQKNIQIAFITITILSIFLGALLGSLTRNLVGIATGVVAVTLTTLLAAFLILAITITITIADFIAGIIPRFLVIVGIVFGSRIGAMAVTKTGEIVIKILGNESTLEWKLPALGYANVAAITGTLIGIFVASIIAWRVKLGKRNLAWIYNLAVTFSSLGGTNFRGANLTDTDFFQAFLKNTNFTDAHLKRTNFYLARKLSFAKLDRTILTDQAVRDLLVSKKGNRSYAKANLQGANLSGAYLSYLDFTGADLSGATLAKATLIGTNLTRTQAIQTDFFQANLTAACLEAWNIDNTTNIEGAICDYVYLLSNQQERRPSSGEFAPGEFTKLFQVVINTVDLIFRNGLDLQALNHALQQAHLEHPNMPLGIKSIENKGEGVVIVRLEIPGDVNKENLHAELMSNYQQALGALETRYEAQLASKEEQIAVYRQREDDWRVFKEMLMPSVKSVSHDKVVILRLGKKNSNQDFPVTLQISLEGKRPFFESHGTLPCAANLITTYSHWQTAYYQGLGGQSRLEIPETQVTNISKRDLWDDCLPLGEKLNTEVNLWFNSSTFRPLKEQLLEKLSTTDSIRMIVQTQDNQLRRIPFQLWDFFESYSLAEVALSSLGYYRAENTTLLPKKMNILAILGNSKGIDLEKDRLLLSQLPNAEVTFLVEPSRQQLNDQLWLKAWDILFFAGHSFTHTDYETGYLSINSHESLTIVQLKNALTKARSQGLQLAIFNSCDGLGIGVNLAGLHIPQMILMREPIPDLVATAFLQNFLREFSNGKSLYTSVREARCQLQGLEGEFPYASWLPVIWQNPGAVPLKWVNSEL